MVPSADESNSLLLQKEAIASFRRRCRAFGGRRQQLFSSGWLRFMQNGFRFKPVPVRIGSGSHRFTLETGSGSYWGPLGPGPKGSPGARAQGCPWSPGPRVPLGPGPKGSPGARAQLAPWGPGPKGSPGARAQGFPWSPGPRVPLGPGSKGEYILSGGKTRW